MLTTRIRYADFHESLACDPIAPGLVELREFSDFLPLGTGDRVFVDDAGAFVGPDVLGEHFIVTVFFDLPTAPAVIEAACRSWTDDWPDEVVGAQPGPNSAIVAARSYTLLDQVVRSHGAVESISLSRSPGTTPDFATLIQES